jgi:hypothetical protein
MYGRRYYQTLSLGMHTYSVASDVTPDFPQVMPSAGHITAPVLGIVPDFSSNDAAEWISFSSTILTAVENISNIPGTG